MFVFYLFFLNFFSVIEEEIDLDEIVVNDESGMSKCDSLTYLKLY